MATKYWGECELCEELVTVREKRFSIKEIGRSEMHLTVCQDCYDSDGWFMDHIADGEGISAQFVRIGPVES